MINTRQHKVTESMFASIPETSIPEIRELRMKLKDCPVTQFYGFYNSGLGEVYTSITKKLSLGYASLFKKEYENGYSIEHNPFESPVTSIIKKQEQIVKAWNIVEQQKTRLIKSLDHLKSMLIPIIKSTTFKDTLTAIGKIPYDSRYFPSEGGFKRSPYTTFGGMAVMFPKCEFDKFVAATLREMLDYNEKEMLTELVRLIRDTQEIVRKTRVVAERAWKTCNPEHEKIKKWQILIHNATGHITVGLGGDTFDALNRIKLIYPAI